MFMEMMMTDRTLYQLERAMDALSLAVQYLKEDTRPYKYSISKELLENGSVKYNMHEMPYRYYGIDTDGL